jgi:Mg-chelatase subunit ChlD
MSIRPWALKRRLLYGFGFFLFLSSVIGGVYWGFFYDPGNCFDNIKNGGEKEVDCGGKCVRICAIDTVPPVVEWVSSFKIADGQYNAVAYINNKNSVASTPGLKYTFELYDGATLVTKREGMTILPPNSIYPVFEGRIYTNGKKVTNTKLVIEPVELWLPALIGREQFIVSNTNLVSADSQPRLTATIQNTELTEAKSVEVVATLFDVNGKPLTASQTFIDTIAGRGSRDITFTWPNQIAKTVRSCSVPSDVVLAIDLSGSMDSDGGNPPQPVTDALVAARNFVTRLREDDQIGVVTFASQAVLVKDLSKDHAGAASKIAGLSIAPAEQTGYTNTPDAFLVAGRELSSTRHSENARRALVLLTDGLPTAKGDTTKVVEEAKLAAKRVADNGVTVYVIGLGKGVNLEFVKTLTEDSENAFYAPTTADLESIYKKITGALCETGTTRIDVVAKTPTNFAPLR